MRRIGLASFFFSLIVPAPALQAQLRASELASVSQTVDGTTFTVSYSRPRARGRSGLFGTRIHKGEVWTPGANRATTLTVTKDVTIEGKAVPKGAYSVWFVTDPAQWEMILDPDTALFHTQRPKQRAGQVRFYIQRQKRPFMETLTWWFPEVKATGATLALQWDTVYVPLRLAVQPTYSTSVAPEVRKRIVGVYQINIMSGPPRPDTTVAAGESPATQVKFTIREEGSELRAVMDPPLFRTEEGYKDWILLPSRQGWFHPARMDTGEIVEISDEFQFQFDTAGERASGFEIRMINDALIGRGVRVN
jgi:hypothetical protein